MQHRKGDTYVTLMPATKEKKNANKRSECIVCVLRQQATCITNIMIDTINTHHKKNEIKPITTK